MSIKFTIIYILSIVVLIGGIVGWSAYSQNKYANDPEIVSARGLHYHPTVAVTIKGQRVTIPANIGSMSARNATHTHDATGVLHMELQGVVRKSDLRLGEFFRIWGKEFSSGRIFENINGQGGALSMTVNGQANSQFENYIINNNDKIEIKYE